MEEELRPRVQVCIHVNAGALCLILVACAASVPTLAQLADRNANQTINRGDDGTNH